MSGDACPRGWDPYNPVNTGTTAPSYDVWQTDKCTVATTDARMLFVAATLEFLAMV